MCFFAQCDAPGKFGAKFMGNIIRRALHACIRFVVAESLCLGGEKLQIKGVCQIN